MADRPGIEPPDVVREVDEYVGRCYHQAEHASNVNLLDEGQVYSLHLLAASIYASGHDAGRHQEARREDGVRRRAFDKTREAEAATRRLALARQAVVDVGYFLTDEVSDDVAPRIHELTTSVLEPLLTMARAHAGSGQVDLDALTNADLIHPALARMIRNADTDRLTIPEGHQ